MEYTASQKRQNVTNSPTAAQLDHQNTPSLPPRVQPRDLYLSMQTQGLRCDRASVQRKIRKQWNKMTYINT